MNPHTQKMPNVHLIHDIPKTTSLNVASVFGKEHKNVLNTIKQLGCSEEFSRLNFEPRDYKDSRGKMQSMCEMTRDGFVFLVMGFTGAKAAAFKEAYINAFNAMALELKLHLSETEIALRDQVIALQEKVIHLSSFKLRSLEAKTPEHARRLFTDAERLEIYTLRMQGLTHREVGEKVGRTEDSVSNVVRRIKNGKWDYIKDMYEAEQQPCT